MFFEVAPLSDVFEQIAFTEEQAKKIGEFVARTLGQQGDGQFEVITDDETQIEIPNSRFTYPQEFFIEQNEDESD